MKQKPKVGLIGFGCVGQGFYHICRTQQNLPFELIAICDSKAEVFSGQDAKFFNRYQDLIADQDISIVVEAINSSDCAFEIAQITLESGKSLVTANKKMVSENLESLVALQKKTQRKIWFEAAVGGAIPIIETLDSHFAYQPLSSLRAILNGTSNYILTLMLEEGWSYKKALLAAQSKGFAESDPTLDVEGYDAKHKLVLLLKMAFGVVIDQKKVFNYGINQIQTQDLDWLKSKGYTVRLLAQGVSTLSGTFRAYVMATILDRGQSFSQVSFEDNCLEINGIYSGKVTLSGKGAGSLPTGSAVFSDVIRASKLKEYALQKTTINGSNFDIEYRINILIVCSNEFFVDEIGLTYFQKVYIGPKRFGFMGKISLSQLNDMATLFKTHQAAIFDLSMAGSLEYHLSIKQNAESVFTV